ncbi:acyltransferase family protein [Pseudomonas sp.]|uniref:acyltransferase family protein n=1 Tax=Pseudomonas sp. TaxID=306 RepID=UPI003A983C77
MSQVSITPVFLILIATWMTMSYASKWIKTHTSESRFGSIDGLRGYLALFVFMHHSIIWYFYLNTGKWAVPPSNIYTHFGQTSVALFFMVTGFLFTNKIIENKITPIDWLRVIVSRVLRLTPLYLFAVTILFIVVTIATKAVLNVTYSKLIIDCVKWVFFTIPGAPDLNALKHTTMVVAGVVWTLPFEWFFYLSLPLLAMLQGQIPKARYIIFSAASLYIITRFFSPATILIIPFFGGIIAAYFARLEICKKSSKHWISSTLATACLVLVVTVYPTAYGYPQYILITIFFIFISSGNDLFGVLTLKLSRTLGELTYSIYLLHGLVLYISFNLIGYNTATSLSTVSYWAFIIFLTPLMLSLSIWTFIYIERPTYSLTSPITKKLRSLLHRLKAYQSKPRITL